MPKIAEQDLRKILATNAHVGTRNIADSMRPYVFGRSASGNAVFDVQKIWDKLYLAARAIAAVPTEEDVCAVSSTSDAQRPVLKFAHFTNALPIVNKFTAGTLTNYITKRYVEPQLLVAADPLLDHRSISESSFVNIPVISFCNANASLRHVDIAIPCNTSNKEAIALMWWFLAREVLKLRGRIAAKAEWTVMTDMFITRTAEEMEKLAREQESSAGNRNRQTAAEAEVRVRDAIEGQDTDVAQG